MLLLDAYTCPKCGAEMEAIETPDERMMLQHLQLCPNCYLVAWNDENGVQFRQGVPVKTTDPPRHRAIN